MTRVILYLVLEVKIRWIKAKTFYLLNFLQGENKILEGRILFLKDDVIKTNFFKKKKAIWSNAR